MHTTYRFRKGNHIYNVTGNNRVEAQYKAELIFDVDLAGAIYEEVFKLRIVRSGICK